jgi:hypothetical protein
MINNYNNNYYDNNKHDSRGSDSGGRGVLPNRPQR